MNNVKLTPREIKSGSVGQFSQLIQENKKIGQPIQICKFDSSSFTNTERFALLTNQYQVVWIKKGYGHFDSKRAKRTFRANCAYMIAPAQHYELQSHSSVEGFGISFTDEFLCRSGIEASHILRLSDSSIFFEMQIETNMQPQLDFIINYMYEEYTNFFSLKSEVLGGLLKILLLFLSRNVVLEPRSFLANNPLEKQFMALLKSDFTAKKRVVDYASDLAVTPNHLNAVVKRITGFTASYHIQQKIINEAKKRALYSLKSMKEISYELGFDDTAHFSKFFKNYSGVCFTDFKHQTERI